MNNASAAHPNGNGYIFRLFVAGDEPYSRTAKDNLKKLCDLCLRERFEIELVDVLESYKSALENDIYLTPALIMVFPPPEVTIYGDLSETEDVLRALRMGADE